MDYELENQNRKDQCTLTYTYHEQEQIWVEQIKKMMIMVKRKEE